MRSTTLVLLLLIGVQAAVNMGGGARVQEKARRDPAQSGSPGKSGASVREPEPHSRAPLSIPTTDPTILSTVGPELFNTTAHSNSTANPTGLTNSSVPRGDPRPLGINPLSNPALEEFSFPIPVLEPELFIESPDSIPTVDPKIFNKRRYRSPRVLFSAHPPDADAGISRGSGSRSRRRASQPKHRGVYSVCESISNWVGNKTKATDITGNEVTVLPDVRINNIVKKQYFFETTCRGARKPGPAGASCLGIDSRHWNSYCTNTHTFVLAMTSFKSLVAWRLIRINAACVCVLSRKSWRQ